MGRDTKSVPAAAAWLGGLGFLPFLALAAALPFLDGAARARAASALLAYGAIILSFLGGIHWGLAIAVPPGAISWRRLTLSVVPALVAWAAAVMPAAAGLPVLAAAMAAMPWLDLRATRAGEAPAWYPRLRWPLACAVTAALLLGSLA